MRLSLFLWVWLRPQGHCLCPVRAMFCAGSARAVFVQGPTLVCYGYVSSHVRVLGRWRVSRIILRRVSKWLARVSEGSIAPLQLPWAVMPVFGDGPVSYVWFMLVPFPRQFCASGSPSVWALVKGLGPAAEGRYESVLLTRTHRFVR